MKKIEKRLVYLIKSWFTKRLNIIESPSVSLTMPCFMPIDPCLLVNEDMAIDPCAQWVCEAPLYIEPYVQRVDEP